MKTIPLTRARHAGNFVIALQDQGQPVEPYISRFKLLDNLVVNVGGNSVMSAVTMLSFAERAALDTGIFDLGFFAGSVPVQEYGEFGQHVAGAPNLYSAIKTFCNEVSNECSAAGYYLTHDGISAWFCHSPIQGTPVLQLQHELYALMIMTQVIQLALGPGWRPRKIRIQSGSEADLLGNEFLRNINIEFNARVTGVEFPVRAFTKPLKTSPTTMLNARNSDPARNLSTEPLEALYSLISGFMESSINPSIEVAAEASGVSIRTLQRYLKSQSTSYSKLLDQVRLDVAMKLLADPKNSITDVTTELGYANIAHFSRAFKRLAGISPRSYRKIVNS